jgi:hypothetical protein
MLLRKLLTISSSSGEEDARGCFLALKSEMEIYFLSFDSFIRTLIVPREKELKEIIDKLF